MWTPRGLDIPGTGVTSGCKLHTMGAGNKTASAFN